MNVQARVGLFTLIGLALLFGIVYFWSDLSTRSSGYRIGVLFDSVAGLKQGSVAYMAGVPIGSVERIDLQPDFKADVIIAVKRQYDIPREAKFVISTPLTGEGTLEIEPPRPQRVAANPGLQIPPGVKLPPGFKLPPGVTLPGTPVPAGATPAPTPIPLWPREVLPLEQQPRGTSPASLAQLTDQGQQTLQRLDTLLAQLQAGGPQLFASVQATVDSAHRLTNNTDAMLAQLSRRFNGVSDQLDIAAGNLVVLSDNFKNQSTTAGPKLDKLLASLNSSADAMNDSLQSLRSLAKDPQLKGNVVAATRNLEQSTRTLAELSNDLRQVTGDPQTQAQLRNTVANFNAASQRANSLLGSLGGTSSVYGVDAGATPAPAGAAGGRVPGAPYPVGSPFPAGSPYPAGPGPAGGKTLLPGASPAPKLQIGRALNNVYNLDVSLQKLSPANPNNPGQAAGLTSDRGPQTNVNLTLLPHARTSLLIGANNIGTSQYTINLAALQQYGRNVHVGGGILYSNIGLLGDVDLHRFSLESRLYDPRWPTLDAYGRLKPVSHIDIFSGERDILHSSRRFVFGVRYHTQP